VPIRMRSTVRKVVFPVVFKVYFPPVVREGGSVRLKMGSVNYMVGGDTNHENRLVFLGIRGSVGKGCRIHQSLGPLMKI